MTAKNQGTKTEKESRLDKLRKQQAIIAERIRGIEAEAAKKRRTDDTREKILLGSAALADINHFSITDKDRADKMRQFETERLERAITAERDREFLIDRGWKLSAPKPDKAKTTDDKSAKE